MSKILVTGGAGFIGSFIVDRLVDEGHEVRIFDNLFERVHGGKIPAYLNPKAEFIKGDVRDIDEFGAALEDIEIVFHEASLVGIEPSMKHVKEFIDINNSGTANLLQLLIDKEHDVKKVLVAGSVAIYGESEYYCKDCDVRTANYRSTGQLERKEWEVKCPKCGKDLEPERIPEEKEPNLYNNYGLTKFDQEVMVLTVCKQYGIPATSLRYFNVYGPRQSPINPYSGVITRFIDDIKAGKDINIFEDGLQSRDFINVKDIANANILAMKSTNANGKAFNVGTGEPTTVKRIAETVFEIMKPSVKIQIPGKFRPGDMRHCTADITKIQNDLGFKPKIELKEGIKEVIEYYLNQS